MPIETCWHLPPASSRYVKIIRRSTAAAIFWGNRFMVPASRTLAGFVLMGRRYSEDDWNTEYAKSFGVFFHGQAAGVVDSRGEQLIDDNFYIAFNAHFEPLTFTIPQYLPGEFLIVANTAETGPVKPLPKRQVIAVLAAVATAASTSPVTAGDEEPYIYAGGTFNVEARSVVVLCSNRMTIE